MSSIPLRRLVKRPQLLDQCRKRHIDRRLPRISSVKLSVIFSIADLSKSSFLLI